MLFLPLILEHIVAKNVAELPILFLDPLSKSYHVTKDLVEAPGTVPNSNVCWHTLSMGVLQR